MEEIEVEDKGPGKINMGPLEESIKKIKALEEQSKLKEINQQNDHQIEEIEEINDNFVEEPLSEELSEDSNEKDNLPNEEKDWKKKRREYKAKALVEKEALKAALYAEKEKAANLEKMLAQSLESGTYHYSKGAYSDLDKAKILKKEAIEEGDIDKVIEADLAINKALVKINDLEKWAYDNNSNSNNYSNPNNYQNYPDPQQNYYNELENQVVVEDWLDDHPYLQRNTKYYNPRLASNVAKYIQNLDERLIQNNREDAILSDEYFHIIDQYIDQTKKQFAKNSNNIRSLSNIGSVRNSYGANKAKAANQIVLTEMEKNWAKSMNIKESDWIRRKLQEQQNNRG